MRLRERAELEMTESVSDDNFARNLRALRDRDARSADWLESKLAFRPGWIEWGRLRPEDFSERAIFHVAEGPTTMLEPEPADVPGPKVMLAALPGDAAAVLLLGISNGERLRRILEETHLPVLVVERYPELARHLFEQYDLERAISSGRLRLTPIAAQQPDDAILSARRTLRGLAQIPGIAVLGSSPWWDRAMRGEIVPWMEYPGILPEAERAFPYAFKNGFLTQLRTFVKRMQEPIDRKKQRIWGVVEADTAAIKTIMAQLFGGFADIGHEASLFIPENRIDRGARHIAALLQAAPHVVVTAIRSAHGALGWLANLFRPTLVSYLTDAPWLAAAEGAQPYHPDGLIFSAESRYGEWVKERQQLDYEMLAFSSSYGDFELPAVATREHEIRFIANVTDPEGRFSALSESEWQAAVELFWSHIDEYATGDLDRFVADLIRLLGWSGAPRTPHVLWGTLYRVSIVEALEGLPLGIYGGEAWSGLLRTPGLKSCYRGWLEPIHELPKVMAGSTIHLNVTSLPNYDSGNMRTFDATGLGCCVLHDRKRDVVSAFEEGREIVFYRSREDIRAQAEALIADRDRCEAIGANARKLVVEEHLPRHRAEQVFRVVETREGQKVRLSADVVELLLPT